MRRIRAKPAVYHTKPTSFIFKDLERTTHVFVRDDASRRSLQPSYLGPYEVLARPNEKLYTVLLKDKPCNISTERLKSAYMPSPEDGQRSARPDLPQPIPSLRVYPGAKKTAQKGLLFRKILGGE